MFISVRKADDRLNLKFAIRVQAGKAIDDLRMHRFHLRISGDPREVHAINVMALCIDEFKRINQRGREMRGRERGGVVILRTILRTKSTAPSASVAFTFAADVSEMSARNTAKT